MQSMDLYVNCFLMRSIFFVKLHLLVGFLLHPVKRVGADGEGGTVLFGVTDKGKIIGQEVSDKTRRDIAEAINRLEPVAMVQISYGCLCSYSICNDYAKIMFLADFRDNSA